MIGNAVIHAAWPTDPLGLWAFLFSGSSLQNLQFGRVWTGLEGCLWEPKHVFGPEIRVLRL